MSTVKYLLFFATGLLIMFACSNKQEPVEEESGLVEITNQQLATDSMKLGEIEERAFEGTVKCNGIIVPLPNGMAKVNALIPGVIKSIYKYNGQQVEKNQPLLDISGNELIDIQKDLAEASANYRRLKSEYERLETLYKDKVTSEKDFILAQSEFKTAQARYNGLKLKLASVGFPVEKIENGEFQNSYTIKSPIKGHLANLRASIGSYVQPETELAEVINPAMFQLQLSVFSSDITNIEKGQTVHFTTGNSRDSHEATISSVGVSLDNNSRSIECYASITDKGLPHPIANQYVESEIIISTDTVFALPADAIIKTEAGYYILVLNKQEGNTYLFDKVEVTPGRQNSGYTEILGDRITGKVLVGGVYNVVL